MSLVEFVLTDLPSSLDVYTIARGLSGESVMQLRKRAADGTALLTWSTDDFPLTMDRRDHYSRLLDAVDRLTSCECTYQLIYRVTPDAGAESVSYDALVNLLTSDLQYWDQEHD